MPSTHSWLKLMAFRGLQACSDDLNIYVLGPVKELPAELLLDKHSCQ